MPVDFDIQAITQRVVDAVERGLLQTAVWVKDDAYRRIVEPPKTGILYVGAPYRIGKPPHQASAPGESPADDTGALKTSGKASMEGRLQAAVTFDAGYARNLELGIPTGDRPLAARPFLMPAVMQGKKQVKVIIDKELKK
jgi:hypothetical protein